jgi:hypothetical protein
VTTLSAAVASVALSAPPAQAENRVTPGNFTGYGFDQCLAPTQAKMDRWLTHSPFLSVGIYISGNSRACRSQPNLTPAWVRTQLRSGWRLLPITLGPQSTCVGRFPRYGAKIDPTIRETAKNGYGAARAQARAEAVTAVTAAGNLGISRGSTLWYDLEGWSNVKDVSCRESALAFLSAWTWKVHQLGYLSGVYSSAGSGMKIVDDARVERPDTFVRPDYIWIARWDGRADTSTSYIREDGWRPGGRVKQYQGGHNETWGGVTINIDRNYLDVGKGSVFPASRPHCKSKVNVDFPIYHALDVGTTRAPKVLALQCLLREKGLFTGPLDGTYGPATVTAVKAWQSQRGHPVRQAWSAGNWVGLLAEGAAPVSKFGSASHAVRRLQRALNAAGAGRLALDGVMQANDVAALSAWQRKAGLPVTGVAASNTWQALRRGRH